MSETVIFDAGALHPQVKEHWHRQWTPPLGGECGINDPLNIDAYLTVVADPLLSSLFVAAAVEGTALALKQNPKALEQLAVEVSVPHGATVTPAALGAIYEWLILAQENPGEVLGKVRDYAHADPNWANGNEQSYLMMGLICHANQAFIRAGYGR